MQKKDKIDPYATLRIKPFRNFVLSRFIFNIAVQMAELIIGWKIYQITHNKLALGLLGLCEALPFIVTSLYSGYAVDAYNRYKIARYALIFLALCFTCIGILISVENFIHTEQTVWPIYLLIGLSGVARGFLAPALQSILPILIPRSLYSNAATWSSNSWQTAAVLGPALGGLLYASTNVEISFFLILCLMFVATAMFFAISMKLPEKEQRVETLMKSLTAGLRFVFKKQEMLSSISLDLFAVLFGGAVALLPVFASDILFIGPEGLGVLRAAPFLGSASMGLFLAYNSPTDNAGRNLLIAVTGFGLATIAFGFSRNFYLSFAMLFLTGAFDNISVVIRQTILQVMTPDNMRGRVSAINQIFISSSNEIGAFESGLTAELMGTVPAVVFGGCMTLLVVIFTYCLAPKIRSLKL